MDPERAKTLWNISTAVSLVCAAIFVYVGFVSHHAELVAELGSTHRFIQWMIPLSPLIALLAKPGGGVYRPRHPMALTYGAVGRIVMSLDFTLPMFWIIYRDVQYKNPVVLSVLGFMLLLIICLWIFFKAGSFERKLRSN
jgi:hypothetical protein